MATATIPSKFTDDDPRTWCYCKQCRDTSWHEHWCPGEPASEPREHPKLDAVLTRRDCGREVSHLQHAYVRRCLCVPTNPKIQEQRERARAKAKRAQGADE